MRAMILEHRHQQLRLVELPRPVPGPGQVLIRVRACGVCRTDLHILDGELPERRSPLVPGHQIVGRVEQCGAGAMLAVGQRVGISWLAFTCGNCVFCLSDRENLCTAATFTGYHVDGGFAEFCLADARFCFLLPPMVPDLQAAPLLCAGIIGYRALRFTGSTSPLGLYGFGASAHTVIQVARFQKREIFAFTRPGDARAQEFARSLGATWAGSAKERSPRALHAAIIFAASGDLVPLALAAVVPGGVVVCAGIHMSDIPTFPYAALWEERSLCSVANLTRRDGREFLELSPRIPIKTVVTNYALEQANEALADLRAGRFSGAAVIDLALP